MSKYTFAMLKSRQIKSVEDVTTWLSSCGFNIVASAHIQISKELAAEFYHDHRGMAYFKDIILSVTESKVTPLLLEWRPLLFRTEHGDAISTLREMIGPTDAREAFPHHLRYHLAPYNRWTGPVSFSREYVLADNGIHASDSYSSFIREAKFFFKDLMHLMQIPDEEPISK